MIEALRAYLNTPISRKIAMAVVIGQTVGTALVSRHALNRVANDANVIIDDLHERLRIYSETTEILMENADNSTLAELDGKLDYWRVIRGIPVEDNPT